MTDDRTLDAIQKELAGRVDHVMRRYRAAMVQGYKQKAAEDPEGFSVNEEAIDGEAAAMHELVSLMTQFGPQYYIYVMNAFKLTADAIGDKEMSLAVSSFMQFVMTELTTVEHVEKAIDGSVILADVGGDIPVPDTLPSMREMKTEDYGKGLGDG